MTTDSTKRDPEKTLDALWTKLGLDSLPGDAGAAEDLRATRGVNWEATTVRMTREVPAQRADLPRISSAPPGPAPETDAPRDDLVVVGLLGEGGMGRVLLSRQRSLGRDVAVKVARSDASPGALQALVHEARTTGALEHPGVIPVYALASDLEGRPALVMKRVDGVSWDRLMHEGDTAWERLAHRGTNTLERHVDILLDVCNAIAFAHSRGILHRDIKPSNVLIGEFGEVYVADWGVAAKKVAAGEPHAPALVGTPVYMAPEMVTGDDSQMDERTDVFLLGSTLFEVLSGKPPFGGGDLREVLTRAWESRREPLGPDAPRELVAICDQAMAASPAARFQSVTALREALTGWVDHRGSVSLARAAHERLDQLLALLRSGSKDRAQLDPLLSECRFGFGQALKGWPGNELAREGLRSSIEAAARFEAEQGNLQAARALCRDLAVVPPDLTAALERLEASEQARAARDARLAHLATELDPRVSQRERLFLFLGMGLVVCLIVGLQLFSSTVREGLRELGLGRFFLAAVMAVYLVVYLAGLWVGRASLLATRLNRRSAGVVGLAIVGPLLNRLAAAFTGASVPQTVVGDMLLTATMTAGAALMLHWGFAVATTAFLVGAATAIVFPDLASPLHGLAAVASVSGVVLTWKRWRNELRVNRGAPP